AYRLPCNERARTRNKGEGLAGVGHCERRSRSQAKPGRGHAERVRKLLDDGAPTQVLTSKEVPFSGTAASHCQNHSLDYIFDIHYVGAAGGDRREGTGAEPIDDPPRIVTGSSDAEDQRGIYDHGIQAFRDTPMDFQLGEVL